MSIKIKEVSIENLNSLKGKSSVSFNGNFILIKGFNEVNQSSNGTGKSSIIEAVIFAIYGKSFKKELNLDDIITDGCNLLSVELLFEDDYNKYKIIRSRSRKPAISKCSFFKNEEDMSSGLTTTETQSLIENTIGVSFQTFINNNMLNTELFKFIKSSSTQKLEILERVLSLGILSTNYNIFQKQERASYNAYDTHYKERYALETSFKNLKTQQENIEKQVEENIKQIQEAINKNKEEYGRQTTELQNVDSSLLSAETEYEEHINGIDQKTRLLGEWNGKKSSFEKELEFYDKNKTCLSCGQSLPNRDEKMQDLKWKIETAKIEAELAQNSINSLKKQPIIKLVSDLKSKKATINETIINLKRTMQNQVAQINQLKNITNNSDQIDEVKKNLEKELELEASSKEVLNIDSFFKDFFAPKSQSRIKIASDLIKILNHNISKIVSNFFVEDVKLIFEVSDGAISETIWKDGFKKKYESLSSGERQKLDIVVVLSLLEISTKFFKNNKLKFLVIDEALDHLDIVWARYVSEYIKTFSESLNITTLLISHHSVVEEIDMLFDSVISVYKDSKGSRILEESEILPEETIDNQP